MPYLRTHHHNWVKTFHLIKLQIYWNCYDSLLLLGLGMWLFSSRKLLDVYHWIILHVQKSSFLSTGISYTVKFSQTPQYILSIWINFLFNLYLFWDYCSKGRLFEKHKKLIIFLMYLSDTIHIPLNPESKTRAYFRYQSLF